VVKFFAFEVSSCYVFNEPAVPPNGSLEFTNQWTTGLIEHLINVRILNLPLMVFGKAFQTFDQSTLQVSFIPLSTSAQYRARQEPTCQQ
jgi:hypothetical protein